MKILVYGMTNARGLPLATVLRYYGRHSVVGYGLEPAPPGGHPDRELRDLELNGPRVPIAPTLPLAIAEGHDLAFVATHPEWVAGALTTLADEWSLYTARQGCTGRVLPTVVVTPVSNPAAWTDGLEFGYAPFTYSAARVTERLLNLREISIRRDQHTRAGVLAEAVTRAWCWVDNKIPVREWI